MKHLLLIGLCFSYSIFAADKTVAVKDIELSEPKVEKVQCSQEDVQKVEKTRLALEKLIKTIDPSQLQLMTGVEWPHYNRAIKNGYKLLKESDPKAAQKKFESATKIVKESIADCKIIMLPNGDMRMGGITLHTKTEEVSFSAKTEVIEDMPTEVLICTDRGRMHETIFITKTRPFHLQTLLHALGAENGARIPNEKFPKQGQFMRVHVQWNDGKGKKIRKPIEYFLRDDANKKIEITPRWVFVGSGLHKGAFIADWSGDVIVNYSVGDSIIDCGEEDISSLKRSLSSWFPKGMKSGTEVKIFISIWKDAKPSKLKKK